MYNPLTKTTIERISAAQTPVPAATPEQRLAILDEQIAGIRETVAVYQATLVRLVLMRRHIAANLPDTTSDDTDGKARLLRAVTK